MKRMTSPAESCTSFKSALRRSSNSPRNFAPAMRAPRSRATTRLSLRLEGTSPFAISHTSNVTLAPSSNPVSVSAPVIFLADHTLYHYRLVASNASGAIAGNDAVFVTSRFAPGLTRNARPRHLRKRPYSVAVGGTLQLPAGFPPDQACKGVVSLRFQAGRRTVNSTQLFLGSNCRYGTRVILPRSLRGTVHVTARFLGNDLLTPQSAKTLTLRIG